MKARPPRSLSAVLARLIWLCMAPLLLLALWFSCGDLKEQEANHIREAGNHVRNFATDNDRFLDARLRALNMLAISPLADYPRHWPELYREAQGFLESFGTHVIFADEQRQMLFNTRQPYGTTLPRLPVSKGHSAAPLALETGKPQVGDIVLGPVVNIPLVAIAVPVLREGKATQLVLSTLEARQFQVRIEQLALPAGWSIALQDGTGTDIARRSPPDFDSARDVDADHRFVVKSQLSPWSVVLEIPRSVHGAEQRKAIFFLAAAILLAIVLGLAGGMLAGRHISRQVASLAEPGGGTVPALEIAEIEAARRCITEADAEIEASHSHLQLWGEAFRHAEVGVAISDSRSEVVSLVSVNPAFARQRGYAADEMVGQSVKSLFPTELHEDVRAKLRALDTLGHVVFESEHLRKDGSRFPVLVDLTTLRDPSGTPINRLAFVFDISECKLAEAALQQSEAAVRTKLKAIIEPEGDIGALELADIIDARMLQSLMEDFYLLTGLLGAVLDVSGKVLVAVGWQDICTKFHRCHAETHKNCIESDTVLTQGVPAGSFKVYRCKNNMWDMATPLMIGGRHVGNVFIGQFFYEGETPDLATFREQAVRYGFDETQYLAALERVPRFSREKVDAGMRFYAKLAEIIATLSFSAIKQSRLLAERERARENIEGQLAELLRWQQVTVGREKRVQQLKDEINYLLTANGQAPRYPGPALPAQAEAPEAAGPDAESRHE